MRWHYWSYKIIYGGIIFPIYALLSIKYWITPFDLIHVNQYAQGVLPYSSKYAILEPFKTTPQFLQQHVMLHNQSEHSYTLAKQFMKKTHLNYPIIAKPERGVIGIGIQKISSDIALQLLLKKIPVNYILQEYADFPYEYSIQIQQQRGKPVEIISLTEKVIPTVKGDGSSTVRELILQDSKIVQNKKALLAHATTLQYIPKKGELFSVLTQASHTYGAVFFDKNYLRSKAISSWVRQLHAVNPLVKVGRFDFKLPNKEALFTGKGVKLIEMNGTTGEPIHIYDEKHNLGFGIKTLYTFYDGCFAIAKAQKKETPILKIIYTYKKYLRSIKQVKKIMG